MTLLAAGRVVGVKLPQEFGAPLRLVGLADGFGRTAQAVERAQETPVRLVAPPHVSGSAPARLAQPVEPTVVADAEVRVGLDVVAPEASELGPRIEVARPAGADVGDGVAPPVDPGECGPQGLLRVVGLRVENCLGRSAGRQVHVGHREGSYGIGAGILAAMSTTESPAATEDDAATEHAAPSEKHKPPTRLVLVRHAVTAHTGPLLSGRMPGIALSEKGVGQAEATAQRLAKLPITTVYASPIERTTQTAQQIAAYHSLDVRPLPGVIEAEYGDWTGGKIADLAKTDEWKVVQVSPSRARFPNGESITEMQARTVAALDEVVARHPNETIVVVSHADPIKSAIAHYSGMHLDLFQRVHVSPASVTVFEFHTYGVIMVKCNDTGGLDDLLPEPESASPNSGAPTTDATAEQVSS
ncbi:MAG: putative phosphomutase, family [Actinomycetia bacterium]|nr:putative phosphomutase, family [Actinomycetes bacterium]